MTLVNGWDPAGVLDAGAARDAYHGIADNLMNFLSGDPEKEHLTEFLENAVRERFDIKPLGAQQFAMKVLTWHQMREA